ncbi:YqzL family protein [Paenibacillus segetis]|jgi:hypothetical protein|uniref:YqzL family protein n=1 Tax=Paenibacillus segetis TaxID=1325360 RepID=A0ABQ1YJN0_9BACL|nr:YqzL family protein [Paenibacillus segetis]GGH26666.1 hypothetical protein GCM10008013_27620 [Paenibacillus segetis]
MRDFSWKYFTMTGDVDAYLLFKEADGKSEAESMVAEEVIAQEEVD